MIPAGGTDIHGGDSGSSGSLSYMTGRIPNKIKVELDTLIFGQSLGEGKFQRYLLKSFIMHSDPYLFQCDGLTLLSHLSMLMTIAGVIAR